MGGADTVGGWSLWEGAETHIANRNDAPVIFIITFILP